MATNYDLNVKTAEARGWKITNDASDDTPTICWGSSPTHFWIQTKTDIRRWDPVENLNDAWEFAVWVRENIQGGPDDITIDVCLDRTGVTAWFGWTPTESDSIASAHESTAALALTKAALEAWETAKKETA